MPADSVQPSISEDTVQQTIDHLIAAHGEAHAGRIRRGVEQVARRWWAEDGDDAAFSDFCAASFLTDPAEIDRTAERIERLLEQVDGHVYEARRDLTAAIDLDLGEISAVELLFADLDLAPNVEEGLFATKVAFLALLNFPAHTLRERLEHGASWDRAAWARSRMMERFTVRVPAAVAKGSTQAFMAAEHYISGYYLRMDRVVDGTGRRLFPDDLRLITHWGLRDELASHYAQPDGLAKQRLIQRIMERIVRQEIPAAVIDNPGLLWNPETNVVRPFDESAPPSGDLTAREPDARYARLLDIFNAVRKIDPYSPNEPTFMARRFERERQIPEREVEELFISVLESPAVGRLAQLIRQRVGRDLEPFDIWYSGFKSRGRYSEDELNQTVRQRYPNLEAFQAALPEILQGLGFTRDKACWLADHIAVDPARGAGHAMPAMRREDKAHLRTRVPKDGMDYQGYNVAFHELGHNVEQVFSLNGIDHWWLSGVPNNAFTEAFAFIFQHRDLEMLGLQSPGEETRRNEALAVLWNTYEIAGVSLVDMRVWDWMYAHPAATPAELREAVLAIARDVWNRWFAPHFGVRDSDLLAIYSHMIVYGLYLPDYTVGHIIAFQVADRLTQEDFGQGVERMTRLGHLTPDAWIRAAVGGPVSADALLEAASGALEASAA
ncbi:MAG TPA: hypothetical protein VH988_00715 [Thermoanaerobaculia bacterium]|jgi:hypothetical protein|nr:hypothetical protein [Thermoanaerobaculia bacterium]